jgi:hypothetical protein
MSVFTLMDEWIAGTGRTDDPWLALGLDVLDTWQLGAVDGLDGLGGQQHLVTMLARLRLLRPVSAAPDPVALAAWFHHCGRLEPQLSARLGDLAGPALGLRVQWLVRTLAATAQHAGDRDAGLLLAVHRASGVVVDPGPVRALRLDQ